VVAGAAAVPGVPAVPAQHRRAGRSPVRRLPAGADLVTVMSACLGPCGPRGPGGPAGGTHGAGCWV